MKILIQYLKPHRYLVFLVLLLAALNIGFSLFDPIIFGKLVNLGFSVKKSLDAGALHLVLRRFFL
jgi:ATP-binding cassette subfamily B protein